MGQIYKITNEKNGLFYIGSCENFEKRKLIHINRLTKNKAHNKRMQNDFNNGGVFNFTILEDNISPLFLTNKEQFYIDNLKPDYNKIKKAIRMNEEQKKKLSISQKEYYNSLSEDEKQQRNKYKFGKKFSLETRQKLREKKLGTKKSAETKQKIKDSVLRYFKNKTNY